MASSIKYLVDDNGRKQRVLVPFKTWTTINNNYQKMSKKLAILTGIENGIDEVIQAKQQGKELQTLDDFL